LERLPAVEPGAGGKRIKKGPHPAKETAPENSNSVSADQPRRDAIIDSNDYLIKEYLITLLDLNRI
jgi:hypothetical protein